MTDKMSKILNLMRDHKPRTLKEIEEAVGAKCSNSITNLYQKGLPLVTCNNKKIRELKNDQN